MILRTLRTLYITFNIRFHTTAYCVIYILLEGSRSQLSRGTRDRIIKLETNSGSVLAPVCLPQHTYSSFLFENCCGSHISCRDVCGGLTPQILCLDVCGKSTCDVKLRSLSLSFLRYNINTQID